MFGPKGLTPVPSLCLDLIHAVALLCLGLLCLHLPFSLPFLLGFAFGFCFGAVLDEVSEGNLGPAASSLRLDVITSISFKKARPHVTHLWSASGAKLPARLVALSCLFWKIAAGGSSCTTTWLNPFARCLGSFARWRLQVRRCSPSQQGCCRPSENRRHSSPGIEVAPAPVVWRSPQNAPNSKGH